MLGATHVNQPAAAMKYTILISFPNVCLSIF
jgi:hypothetical protein